MAHVSILEIVTVDKEIGYYDKPDLGHTLAHENKGGVGPVFENPIKTTWNKGDAVFQGKKGFWVGKYKLNFYILTEFLPFNLVNSKLGYYKC